jgi:hypothetical protein
VHRLDAAKLFRLALEKGEAGAKYRGVGEVGISFRDIASLIATKLQVPDVSIPTAKATKHFGMLGNFVCLDNPASSEWTRQALGRAPEQEGLLADMDAHYFQSQALNRSSEIRSGKVASTVASICTTRSRRKYAEGRELPLALCRRHGRCTSDVARFDSHRVCQVKKQFDME